MAKQNKVFKVGVLTPYLMEDVAAFSNMCEGTKDFIAQVLIYGYDPKNFINLKLFKTQSHVVSLEKLYDKTGCFIKDVYVLSKLFDIKTFNLIIAGSTEDAETVVNGLKNFNLIVARYSIFYGKPNGYTGKLPEETGYSLDIPKQTSAVKALLHDDNALDALIAREEMKIKKALKNLNKTLSPPILITPYLSEVLKKWQNKS